MTLVVKVRTFWETHKIWKNPPHGFDKLADLLSRHQNHEEDFFKFCVLLRKSELYQKKRLFSQWISCFNPLCMNMKRCSVLFCDASLSMPLIPSLSKKRRIGRSNPTPFDKNTVQHYLRGESPYLCSRSCTSYTIFDFGLIDVFPRIVSSIE